MNDSHHFPYLADKPVGEDGYYMLTVAWNMAEGHGITYNYETSTTGIQPLATFMYSGMAWMIRQLGGDKWMLIRFVILFGVLNAVLFAHLLGLITKHMASKLADPEPFYAYGYILSLFNFTVFRWFTYGLETGIYLTLLAGCLLFSVRILQQPERKMRHMILFGVLAGFTGLTRIDFGVILMLFLAGALSRKLLSFKACVVIGVIALIIVFPWMYYVHTVTGSFIPSSGTAQARLISPDDAFIRIGAIAQITLGHLTPWAYVKPGGILTLFAIGTLLLGFYFLFRDKTLYPRLWSVLKSNPLFILWTLSFAVLIVIYPLFFWAIHFYQRYTLPLVIPLTVILALTLSSAQLQKKATYRQLALYGMPAFFLIWSFLSLHTGRIGNPLIISSGYVLHHLGAHKVGAFQSGVIGYFNPNVINLDGKVNYAVLSYVNDHRLEEYIKKEKIAFIIDEPPYIFENLNKEWLMNNWKPCSQETGNSSLCFCEKE